MTRQERQALAGFRHSAPGMRRTGGTARSGRHGGAPGRDARQDAVPGPAQDRARARTAATAVRAGRVGAVAYLAVLVCVTAGVYIAWHLGSQGGGRGGIVAGAALLAAAVIRLLLPGRMAGLLASRHRVTDVLTLTVFGVGLLAVGLVLPRLGPLSAEGRMAGPDDERETRIRCPKSRWQIQSSR